MFRDSEENAFKPQIGTERNIMTIQKSSTYENVSFKDQTDTYEQEVQTVIDPTRTMSDLGDATLDRFFSRPLKIHTEEWGTGTNLYFQIDPWDLYFSNPRVLNRITNYKLLRASLKIKIVLNGNSFQYGRAIASYLPLSVFDTMSQNAGAVLQDIVQASQQPHIFLDPTSSSGGEMCLPFFWHRNYMDIPMAEWNQMGDLTVRSINALKHANGATDKVTISVFAWAENVEMSVLTSHDVNTLVPQMGEEKEANENGIISGPASNIAKIAGILKVVPAIAPFATATEMASSTVASIARLFGYSRPVVYKDPEPYKPMAISDMATCNNPDTVRKLTVDCKQELSIDPRIAGLQEHDPLCIKDIAQRESYLTTFDWVMGTAPETLLWNCRVSPMLWAESGSPPPAQTFHLPACAYAVLPFKYWTGSIKFRFQIVCSSFHKGRIKVVYDPDFVSTNEYNTNYIQLVDISEDNDFSITIGPAQERSLMEISEIGVDAVSTLYSTTQYASKENGNGVIGVYIVNELTTPNSAVNNDIQINVFVSACDDFEVFVPRDRDLRKMVFKPQIGEEVSPESFSHTVVNPPELDESYTLGVGKVYDNVMNKVFIGESITSFRQLAKRYYLHTGYGTANTGDRIIHMRRPGYPYLRGNVTGAVNVTGAAAPYNYCNTVLLHWLTMPFSGFRGSIRWKVVPITEASDRVSYTVSRDPVTTTQNNYFNLDTTTPVFTSVADAGYISSDRSYIAYGHNGIAFQTSQVNPVIEFEIPYYNFVRFTPGKQQNWTGINAYTEAFMVNAHQNNVTAADYIAYYCAAGEDFQTYFWTGLPRIYRENVMPVP